MNIKYIILLFQSKAKSGGREVSASAITGSQLGGATWSMRYFLE